MDSLSQIVLGAATGEVVLGKKIGNRALFLGAVAGTIPDLDVLANPFLTPMQAMDFHRGISHSILFAVVAPLLMALIARRFYERDIHHNKKYRGFLGGLPLLLVLMIGGIAVYAAFTEEAFVGMGISVLLLLLMAYPLLKYIFKTPGEIEKPTYLNWYWFFFFITLTHILLDVLTTYGTQIFQPFSNARVAVGSVSVVDPIYTFPFCIFIILVSMMRRQSSARSIFNWMGIGLSSLYLLFGIYGKTSANEVFKNTLKEKEIAYERFNTNPTIFNTILWSGTVEKDSSYLIGTYSYFDSERRVKRFIELPKNHDMLEGHEDDEHVEILRRFSNGYYFLQPNRDSTGVVFTDLRWGALDLISNMPESERFPMDFELKLENGEYRVQESIKEMKDDSGILSNLTRLPTMLSEMNEKYPGVFHTYWDRIMGRWQ